MLRLVEAAVAATVDLIQIREKTLTARTLYDLTVSAARITRGSHTRLLVNDAAHVAMAAGANGVHLATSSLPSNAVRQAFGEEILIGASTHSLAEAIAAHQNGANFVVYGPVFETKSKSAYGEPVGMASLRRVSLALAPFPVLALGGVNLDNVEQCVEAGASGVAAIGMFRDPNSLGDIVRKIRDSFETSR